MFINVQLTFITYHYISYNGRLTQKNCFRTKRINWSRETQINFCEIQKTS